MRKRWRVAEAAVRPTTGKPPWPMPCTAMTLQQELSAFSHSVGVMRRTQAMLGQLGGELEQGKELRLP